MEERKIVILEAEQTFTLALTDEQLRLLKWLDEHEILWDEIRYQVQDGTPEII